jgi:hypothetical protein
VPFHPFVPEGSEKISRNRDIPQPFGFKPPLATKELICRVNGCLYHLVLLEKSRITFPISSARFKDPSQAGLEG